MPSGKTHDKVNDYLIAGGMTAFISFILYFIYGLVGAIVGVGFIVGYVFGTRYNGPDLDVKSRLYYRWGILKFIWRPYQKTFSHRSIFTHGIIIGDIIRYLYLVVVFGIGYLFLEFIMNKFGITKWLETISIYHHAKEMLTTFFSQQNEWMKYFIASLFIGNTVASTVHIITDHTVSKAKRLLNKSKKR